MPGIHYGTHRAIACIILHKHGILLSDEVVGRYDSLPLTAGKLVNLYNNKRLVVSNTTIQNGEPKPWFTALKVTRMLERFELKKMFIPAHIYGKGIYISRNKGTKHLLQDTLEWEFDSTLTVASYIKNISKGQLKRLN